MRRKQTRARGEVPRRRLAWLGTATLVLGCASRSAPVAAPPDADAGADGGDASFTCPSGMRVAPDGDGCVEIAAPGPCPAGTASFLGSATCQPVGWTGACPAGMQPDPSGWGCIDISTSDTCADTTTEALGQTGCVPVGDCAAPFPPSTATLFVNEAYAPSQLDASHFLHVADAIAAAHADAVIAILPGTYAEDVRPKASVSLVGQCASQVSLVNPGDTNPGISVLGVDVKVAGLTLNGHHQGLYVAGGGTAPITDSIVLASVGVGIRVTGAGSAVTATRVRVAGTVVDAAAMRNGWGVRAEAGTSLTVTDSAVVGNTDVGVFLVGASGTVNGTLVARTVPQATGAAGQGVVVGYASTLTMQDSAIVGCHSSGITVQNTGSHATMRDSVVRGTVADSSGYGQGVAVAAGATATVTSCLVAETASAAVLVAGTDTMATVSGTVLRGPIPGRPGTWGPGAQAQGGAHLELDGTAIVGVSAAGFGLTDPGTTGAAQGVAVLGTVPATVGGTCAGVVTQSSAVLTIHGSSVLGNTSLGLTAGTTAGGATVVADGLLVQGGHPDSQGNFGGGVQCANGGTLTLSDSALVGNAVDGLSLGSQSKGTVSGTVIRASVVDPNGHFGYGIIASNGASLALGASFVRDNPGIGLTFSDAMGSVSSSRVVSNAVGILAQSGSVLTVSDATSPLATGEVRVSSDTAFAGNGSNIGSGVVPLPPAPL